MKLESIKDFPSKQAEEIQNKLKDLDKQGKLKEAIETEYKGNLGENNSLLRYCLDNWETRGKQIYLEYTGIETYKSDKTKIKATGIKINSISYGSGRYFLWKCATCGNEWVANITNRTNLNNNCPACNISINTCITGVNDLETYCNSKGEKEKILLIEFKTGNNDVKASEISKGSNKKFNWQCKNCGYTWQASVLDRVFNKSGCPNCNGNNLIVGKNDLETFCNQHNKFKYLLKEFIGKTEIGNEIAPSEIAKSSHLKVWWECENCHKRWLASPLNRTSSGETGCPYCSIAGTSFPEQYLFMCLKQAFKNVESRYKIKEQGYEYDIYISDINLYIEYSGVYWHKERLIRDKEKEVYCKSIGANFIQIYAYQEYSEEVENIKEEQSREKIAYVASKNKQKHIKQLQEIIKFILKEYCIKAEIDFNKAEKEANEAMKGRNKQCK